ncbi:hypothetical protein DL765_000724 [Monosporascus sp. GIB2]|nr:hypothetical protein DL765_000724 [Monosporascus sp. GIB2]
MTHLDLWDKVNDPVPALPQHPTWGQETPQLTSTRSKFRGSHPARTLHLGPGWRGEDPLTSHVDPLTDPGSWEAVRAEFDPGVLINALQLVTREALDDCILRSRLGDPRGFHNALHPPLLCSFKKLRARRTEIQNVGQFMSFLGCLGERQDV